MVIFLFLLLIMFVMNLPSLFYGCRVAAWNLLNKSTFNLYVIEDYHTESFWCKTELITFNGFLNRIMGARKLNGRYKLDNGHMTPIVSECDVTAYAEQTVNFQKELEKLGIPMVYINAPFKIEEGNKQLPIGVEDYSNENANSFIEIMEKNNVPVLDLRKEIIADNLNYPDLFYYSDHHWREETGFWAAGKIISYLTDQDSSFSVDSRVTDLANYTIDVYENIFMGSIGRRVGPLYVEPDDMKIITPAFETSLTYSAESINIYRNGSFSETLLFLENLHSDSFVNSSSYNVYGKGDYDLIKIQNHGKNFDVSCTPKKLLIIKDSYCSVVYPFLSLGYEEIHIVDKREFGKDLLAHVKDYDPDYVLILYNPQVFEIPVMFDFLP